MAELYLSRFETLVWFYYSVTKGLGFFILKEVLHENVIVFL